MSTPGKKLGFGICPTREGLSPGTRARETLKLSSSQERVVLHYPSHPSPILHVGILILQMLKTDPCKLLVSVKT